MRACRRAPSGSGLTRAERSGVGVGAAGRALHGARRPSSSTHTRIQLVVHHVPCHLVVARQQRLVEAVVLVPGVVDGLRPVPREGEEERVAGGRAGGQRVRVPHHVGARGPAARVGGIVGQDGDRVWRETEPRHEQMPQAVRIVDAALEGGPRARVVAANEHGAARRGRRGERGRHSDRAAAAITIPQHARLCGSGGGRRERDELCFRARFVRVAAAVAHVRLELGDGPAGELIARRHAPGGRREGKSAWGGAPTAAMRWPPHSRRRPCPRRRHSSARRHHHHSHTSWRPC